MSGLIRRLFGLTPKHTHAWGMFEAIRTRTVYLDDVQMGPLPITITEQRKVCQTCGKVAWVRI